MATKAFYEELIYSNQIDPFIALISESQSRLLDIDQTIGGKNYQKVRSCSIDDSSEAAAIVRKQILKINKEHFQYDLFGTFEYQLLHYLPGSHYTWHCDYGISSNPKGDRKLSYSIQLSPMWDYRGGELVIRDWYNKDYYVKSEVGTTVVFDSRCPHKVNKITVGERYAVVAWAHGPKLR